MSDNLPIPAPDDAGAFILYQTEDGQTRIDVRMADETVWLSQKAMADLFQKDVRTINDHVRNIFEEGELREDSVIRKYRITAADRKSYDTLHYNLDVIIAVGYSKFFTGTASERVGVIPEALDFILQQDDGQSRFVQAVTELCLGKSTSTAKLTVARALPG